MDEHALLSLADNTTPEEASSSLSLAAASFTDTAEALRPADYEIEQSQERMARFAAQANRRSAEAKAQRSELAAGLFRSGSKSNLEKACTAYAVHDLEQIVLADVIQLASGAVDSAKQKSEAAKLAHLKSELAWTRAKAIVEAKDLLTLIRPLLAFDSNLKIDASGKLAVYLDRISQLENEVITKGVN